MKKKTLTAILLGLLALLICLPALCAADEYTDAGITEFTRTEIMDAVNGHQDQDLATVSPGAEIQKLPRDAGGKYIVPAGAISLGDDGLGTGDAYIEPREGVKVLRNGVNGLRVARAGEGSVWDADRKRSFTVANAGEAAPAAGEKVIIVMEDNTFDCGVVESYTGGVLTLRAHSETDHTLLTYCKTFHLGASQFNFAVPIDAEGKLRTGVTESGEYKARGRLIFYGSVDGGLIWVNMDFNTKVDFAEDYTGSDGKKERSHINVKLDPGEIEYHLELIPEAEIPIVPLVLSIDLSPEFIISGNAEGNFDFRLDLTEGFHFYYVYHPFRDDEFAFERHSDGPNFSDFALDAKGSVKIGLAWGPEVDVLEGLVGLGIKYEGGAKFTATWTPEGFYGDERDRYHACEKNCVQIVGRPVLGPLAIDAKVAWVFKKRILDIVDEKEYDPFLHYYNSWEFNDSGLEECPHHAWKLDVKVTDTDGKAIRGAEVSADPLMAHYHKYSKATTDAGGNATLYIPYDKKTVPPTPDEYTLTASLETGDQHKIENKVKWPAARKESETEIELDLRTATITFEDTGTPAATDMPQPITVYMAETTEAYLPKTEPKKSGQHFLCWTTEKDGGGTKYPKGSKIKVTGDVTLYAQYEIINETYVVMYDANGGDSAPMPQVTKLGQPTYLTKEPAVWENHTFLGWSYDSMAGGVDFPAGTETPLVNKDHQRVIVLYAVWTFDPVDKPVKLSYNMNGGPEGQKPADRWAKKDSWLTVSDKVPVWSKLYLFAGWDEDPDAEKGRYAPGDTILMNRDRTLYAIWKYDPAPEPYTLRFADTGSGTAAGIPAAITFSPKAGTKVQIPDRTPAKSGLHFTGWNEKEDGTGTIHMPGETFAPGGDMTLYARWQVIRNSYVVLYNANGGTSAPQAQIVPLGQDAQLSGEPAVWASHRFLGWALKDDADVPDYPYGKQNVISNPEKKPAITLYAVWGFKPVDKPARLSFDMNGGPEGQKPSDQWAPAGTHVALSAAKPSWDGQHTFLGWGVSRDQKSDLYQPGENIRLDRDTKLYAIWSIKYTITEGNGSVWKTGDKALRFTADGNAKYFYHLQIDGTVIYQANYALESGSTVVTLPPAFLNTLKEGTHTIRFIYTDGTADGTFGIRKTLPPTGDEADLILWGGLVILGIAGMAVAMAMHRKKK